MALRYFFQIYKKAYRLRSSETSSTPLPENKQKHSDRSTDRLRESQDDRVHPTPFYIYIIFTWKKLNGANK